MYRWYLVARSKIACRRISLAQVEWRRNEVPKNRADRDREQQNFSALLGEQFTAHQYWIEWKFIYIFIYGSSHFKLIINTGQITMHT